MVAEEQRIAFHDDLQLLGVLDVQGDLAGSNLLCNRFLEDAPAVHFDAKFQRPTVAVRAVRDASQCLQFPERAVELVSQNRYGRNSAFTSRTAVKRLSGRME